MQIILPAYFQLFNSIVYHIRRFRSIALFLMLFLSVTAFSEDGNLLVNPGAESDYSGWIKYNGGDGWSTTTTGPHSGSRCWSSSYDPCKLVQTIDLKALGYDTTLLDSAPLISAGAYVTTNTYSSGIVTIRIDLLNAANVVIKTGFAVNNQEMNHKYWLLKYTTLSGYGAGMRKIRVTLIGEGTRFWAGQYGPSFDDAFVYLLTQTKAITDDATLISTRSATFNGVVYPNDNSCTVAFEYGTSKALGYKSFPAVSPVSGSAPVAVNDPAVLFPNKTYYYRFISFNSSDTSKGDIKSLKTPAVVLTPSVTSVAMIDTACKATVNITSNISWNVNVDVPWLSVSQTSGTGNASLILTAEANPTFQPRIAKLTLNGDTLADKIITVTQNMGTIHIFPTTMTMDSDADTLSIKVRTIFKWAAVANVPWIIVSSDSIGGPAKLVFRITENAGKTNRTGIITLSNKYISKTFTIVQNKGVFVLTPTSFTVGAQTRSYEINVGTNFTWAATTNVPWISISPDSVSGTSVTVFTVSENNTGLGRTGIITISNSRISASLNVRQGILEGSGTAVEPYLIRDYNGLKYVKNNLGAHYQLTNDIDAGLSVSENGGLGFEPIGNTSNQFTGNMNGNGYVIKNLHIQRSNYNSFVGLTGYSKNATIQNLGLLNCSISGYSYVGGLAGLASSSTIQNCFVSGIIAGEENIGGLIGYSSVSTVTHCYVAGKVTGKTIFGGIAGNSMYNTISDSYSIADLMGGSNGGGLIGEEEGSSITNCYAAGKISGTSIKGLIGNKMFGSVVNSYYDSEVSLLHDTGNGVPLNTADMKSKISFVSWDFNSVWTIRGDSTYPGLRSLNNAPFAFADTLEVKGYTRIPDRIENDFDIEKLQTDLVTKTLQITGNGNVKNGCYTFPAGTVEGTMNSIIYKIGEVLSPGDTLWGNISAMVLKKVANASPTALNDTITIFQDEKAVFDVSQILANDGDSDGNFIYPDTIFNPRNGNLVCKNDSFIYTPIAGWNGIDTILYVLSDGDKYDTAIISIIVVRVSEISWENPDDISYGTPLSSNQLNALTGIPGSFIYSHQVGTVLNAGSYILMVKFIPTDTLIFTRASKSVIINVNKADLIITANNQFIFQETPIPDLTYKCDGFVNDETITNIDELPLISTTATVSSAVGQYAITLSGGSDENYNLILNNGVLDIAVNYAPVALNDTFSVLKEENLIFSKSDMLLNDSDPEGSSITLEKMIPGYPKNGSLTEADNLFSYTSNAGWSGVDTILYVINDGYGTDTAIVSIFVYSIPEIIWINPDDITYGTALGSIQLNAFTGIMVPGTFSYSPQAGMILNAGDSQVLSVEFVPEDSLLFRKAVKSVFVNVKKADLTIIADGQSIIKGTPLPEFSLTYEGFVNGDDVSDLNELPVVTTEATESSNDGNYAITLSGGNDDNYNYILQNGILEITTGTGVNEIHNEITAFPNPFTDYIILQGLQTGVVYTIANTSGNIIKKGLIENNYINLSMLSAGAYILCIHQDGTAKYVKIIKQ